MTVGIRQAQSGDTVSVHYSRTRSDGTVFDASIEREPIEVTLGGRHVIAGFEDALLGMAIGDRKTVTLAPEDAYGPRNPQLVHVVERTRLPAHLELKVGGMLQATEPGGNRMSLMVVELGDDSVTLDANHPLAGETLTFELELMGFID